MLRCANVVLEACQWARRVWTAQLVLRTRLVTMSRRHILGHQSANLPHRLPESQALDLLEVCRLVAREADHKVVKAASHLVDTDLTCHWTVLVSIYISLFYLHEHGGQSNPLEYSVKLRVFIFYSTPSYIVCKIYNILGFTISFHIPK